MKPNRGGKGKRVEGMDDQLGIPNNCKVLNTAEESLRKALPKSQGFRHVVGIYPQIPRIGEIQIVVGVKEHPSPSCLP